MATVNIKGLGQHGFMPDVAPSELPPTGFTYARNFRFMEGQFAKVTDGYTNAFDTRNRREFGVSNTDATFMYTWLLSNDNAIAYYDAGQQRLQFIENNNANNIVEFNMSVDDVYSDSLTYATSGATAGTFVLSSNTISLPTGTLRSTIETAAVADAIVTVYEDRVPIFSRTVSANAVVNDTAAVLTVDTTVAADGTGGVIPVASFTAGSTYEIRVGTPIEHDDSAAHLWQATDAFGIPIFNNSRDIPYVFNDSVIPHVGPLDNFPTTARCRFMTKFGGFIFALGYNNANGPLGERGNARTIAISDVITTPGSLPNWDFSNTQSFAQIFDLSLYSDGDLVSAYEANNTLYVNTTTDVITFVYDGNGQFNASLLPIGGGVLTPRTSTPIPNGFFNIGSGRIYIHDGNSFTEVGDGIWSQSWFTNVDVARLDEVQVVYDNRSHAVWIKTPISDTAQEMWIYNLNNKTLSVLDDHQEIRYITRSAEGVPAENSTWDTFHPTDDSWEGLPQNSWNEFPVLQLGEFRDRVLSCGGREFYVHDFGSSFNGRAINAVVQREYLRLTDNTYGTYTIHRVIPWLRAPINSQYSIRVGGASTTATETSWTPYQTYTVGRTEKLDFRRNVKWGGYTVLTNVSGAEISGLEVDVTSTDRR